MSRRDLSALDRDIGQDWSRIIMEYFRDGSTGAVISEGGLIANGTAQGVLSVSATQNYLLGTKLEKDRKIYRYAQTDTGTALAAGTLLESPAFGGGADAAEEDCPVDTASTAGSTYGYATLQSTGGAAANAFQYGHYIVNDGGSTAGEGQCMKIASHPVSTAGSTSSIKFTFEEALPVGITTGAAVTLLANEFKDVIITTSGTAVGMVVGVSRVAVPVATPYFWCQRSGIASCLCSTATAQSIGKKVHRYLGLAGGVVISDATTGMLTEVVGSAAMAGDVTDSVVVNLTLE